jgi:hypothetical protein
MPGDKFQEKSSVYEDADILHDLGSAWSFPREKIIESI